MNVLSLFNGMSFCRMALDTLDVPVTKYYSSEIDKYANQAAQALFPDTIQLGDVIRWRDWDVDWASIDLVTGGFPCQAWSMAGKQLGDKDERGMLFWTMLDIIKHVKYLNPKADFMLENVKMKKEFEEYITTHTENALGKVHKVLINSALVSAQNRNRYYWTSFAVNQPVDKGVLLIDIIESGVVDQSKSYCIDANYYKGGNLKSYFEKHRRQLVFMKQIPRGFNKGFNKPVAKSPTIGSSSWQHNNHISNDGIEYRKLTVKECFRLQTVPKHHIDTLLNAGISNTQLYKMCGNGWTHDVITHIFKDLTKGE